MNKKNKKEEELKINKRVAAVEVIIRERQNKQNLMVSILAVVSIASLSFFENNAILFIASFFFLYYFFVKMAFCEKEIRKLKEKYNW